MLYKPRSFWCIVHAGRDIKEEAELIDDGVKQIGEPYRAAIERFLAEGLIQYSQEGAESEFFDLVVEYKIQSELVEMAQQHGVDSSGTKRQLVERILEKAGRGAFWDVSVANQLFVRTEKGTKQVDDFQESCFSLRKGFQGRIYTAFCEGDFRTGLRLHKSFYMHTNGEWLLDAEEANEVVSLIQSKNNIYRVTEGEFSQLKAALALQVLWNDVQLRDWIPFEIKLKTSGASVGEDLLQEAFRWDMSESDVLENLAGPG
jgi:hypothetical protein